MSTKKEGQQPPKNQIKIKQQKPKPPATAKPNPPSQDKGGK